MAWQKGPLPAGTWGWGGVVPYEPKISSGFFFADFDGDKVTLVGTAKEGTRETDRVLKPHEVKWFDNSITLPPKDEE